METTTLAADFAKRGRCERVGAKTSPIGEDAHQPYARVGFVPPAQVRQKWMMGSGSGRPPPTFVNAATSKTAWAFLRAKARRSSTAV